MSVDIAYALPQEKEAHPVDEHVGGRVRARRTLLGISQTRLAEALGLTFQQIQKYEKGSNRISASRLFEISNVLDVPVSFFFEGYASSRGVSASTAGDAAPSPAAADKDKLERRETLSLIRAYYRVRDEKQRRLLFDLIKSLAGKDE